MWESCSAWVSFMKLHLDGGYYSWKRRGWSSWQTSGSLPSSLGACLCGFCMGYLHSSQCGQLRALYKCTSEQGSSFICDLASEVTNHRVLCSHKFFQVQGERHG